MKNILLIVDDDLSILKVLRLLLQKKNYLVLSATSGKEALQILKNHAVQVLIVDQQMPSMTGTELLKRVKKRYPKIISILLSAHADLDTVQSALNEGGIYKFITKPWDNKELLKHVEAAFTLFSKTKQRQSSKTNPQEKENFIINSLYKDVVTGLNNRYYFVQKLLELIKDHQPSSFAVIYINIDHFSGVNANFGHIVGDMVLREFGVRLKTWLKDDSLLARLGNDEFALIIHFQAPFEIESIIHTIQKIIREPFAMLKRSIHMSGSIGMSLYPKHSTKADELIQQAQLAMHHCKEKLGSDNSQIYYPELSSLLEIERTLGEELHLAVEREEFAVYYQPVIDVKTKKITGAEALVRWKNPRKGLIQPDQFIPLCESIGLIFPIGAYVLKEACRQTTKWHELGFSDLTIAVNLSARQFNHVNLKELIIYVLETLHFPPQCFNLEITESVLIQDDGALMNLMHWFDTLGLHLSLDDFGTGYSSLKYLQQFPFNNLKIDKSFIEKMDKSNKGLSIVETIIKLGQNLGLTVIAEGVETESQYELLKKLNCDLLQGFLFSKPVPGDVFQKLLVKNRQQFE